MKDHLLLITFCFISFAVFGQNKRPSRTDMQIKGQLLYENGEAFPNIVVQNGRQRTVTDLNGWFAIHGKIGDTLIVLSQKHVVDVIPFNLYIQKGWDKIVQLEEVTVTGKNLQTLGRVSINKEEIARSRGSSNADVFNGIPGIQVNNIRNEAGALDIGIRGLQNDGRVPIIIDGGIQSTQTFRGYQGSSDRTYIEMDLIKKIDIRKGADIGSALTGATGGIVEMRTLEARDLISGNKKWGMMFKGNMANNNKTASISENANDQQYYIVQNSIKPSDLNNLSTTLAAAYKFKKIDVLAAFSSHLQGNHFAGKNGADRYGYNPTYYDSFVPAFRDNYRKPEVRPGQEVVNTSYRSRSVLLKLGWDIATYQRLEASYRYHRQDAGEVLASYWYKNLWDSNGVVLPKGTESMPQWALGSARYQTYNVNYRYNPNTKINMEVFAHANRVNLEQHNGLIQNPGGINGDQYLHKYKNLRQGVAVLNTTTFSTMPLILKYGVSFQYEQVRPLDVPKTVIGSARDANRAVYSSFVSGSFKWKKFLFQGEVKLHDTHVEDHTDTTKLTFGINTDLIGKVTFITNKWLNLYAKASKVNRAPSIYEASRSVQTFSYNDQYPLKTEFTNVYELGFQTYFPNLFKTDTIAIGASGFYNDTKKFISAVQLPDYIFSFLNYDRYRLMGVEMGVTYQAKNIFFNASAIFFKKALVCSNILGENNEVSSCNTQGFDWSVLPNRIPPARTVIIRTGFYAFNRKLTIGGKFRYHSEKQNPKDWLRGTGAAGIAIILPADHTIDMYGSFRFNRFVALNLNVDNLTDRYQYDVGTVIRMPIPGRTIRIGIEANF